MAKTAIEKLMEYANAQALANANATTTATANVLSLGGQPTIPITPGAGSSLSSVPVTKPNKNSLKKAKIKVGDTIKFLAGDHRGHIAVVGCVHDAKAGHFYLTQESMGSRGGHECAQHGTLYEFGGDGNNLPNGYEIVARAKKKKGLDTHHLGKLVLPEDDIRLIESVLQQTEHHSKIFKNWGLEETIEYGRGMGFLFWGLPGTGKTFAALCIARSLGKELLSISPAEIQTQEPGGANRAIQQAFHQATKEKKVLLLDECDGLIGNRETMGMILASEVNTLLTEIEKFEGVVILATNRVGHLDPALERRLSLILEFKVPDQASRALIWKGILPKKMPIKNISAEELAEIPLTGGQIKNAVLGAARLAAAQKSRSVDKEHFEQAINTIVRSKNLIGSLHGRRKAIYARPQLTNH